MRWDVLLHMVPSPFPLLTAPSRPLLPRPGTGSERLGDGNRPGAKQTSREEAPSPRAGLEGEEGNGEEEAG